MFLTTSLSILDSGRYFSSGSDIRYCMCNRVIPLEGKKKELPICLSQQMYIAIETRNKGAQTHHRLSVTATENSVVS